MSEFAVMLLAGLAGLAVGLGIDRLIVRHAPVRAGHGPRDRAFTVTATGLSFALVALLCLRTGGLGVTAPRDAPLAFGLATAALLVIAAAGLALTVIDMRTHRLPNAVVLPALAASVALFAASCLAGAPWSALVRAVTAGAVVFTAFALLRLAGRGAMGGGDVKLAALLGVALGWVGWAAVLVGVLAAFILGGLVGVALIVARRASRRTAIPFGPLLVAGSWVGIVAGDGLL